ncbi:hypothetical protein EV421DRAFT_1932795 [Armillaria borealis]|uniref:DUF6534 domain-containing protein n=1 Tax=Armillaria borealis TaxID=47425 RepID=A0AA39MTZ5_9AGAR|nr:hypothetical protein EV421DRAFT_1932795 [Armillaria borealis]
MQPVPAGYPIEELSGPFIVACLLNWGLFGTLSVQLYLYYLAFPNDRRFTKHLVYGIYVIEFVSLTSSVAAMITGIYSFQAGNVTKLTNRKTSIAVGIWCGTSALCDILIAICMTYHLMRNNTSLRRTRMLITKLIRLIIETGTVTAVVALLNLILFFVFPHQTFYTTPAPFMPKLYANTVYMVLNSRFRIISGRDTYVFNRYEHHDHDDKRYHLSISRRHTASGWNAKTGVSCRNI